MTWRQCTVEWLERGQRQTEHVQAMSPAHAKKLVPRPRGARGTRAWCGGEATLGGARRRRKRRTVYSIR